MSNGGGHKAGLQDTVTELTSYRPSVSFATLKRSIDDFYQSIGKSVRRFIRKGVDY